MSVSRRSTSSPASRPTLLPRGEWSRDEDHPVCQLCQLPFRSLFRRRHHCRICGFVICDDCSPERRRIGSKGRGIEDVRVCTRPHCSGKRSKFPFKLSWREDTSEVVNLFFLDRLSLTHLRRTLRSWLAENGYELSSRLTVEYRDVEGDAVRLTTDQGLNECYQRENSKGKQLKLYLPNSCRPVPLHGHGKLKSAGSDTTTRSRRKARNPRPLVRSQSMRSLDALSTLSGLPSSAPLFVSPIASASPPGSPERTETPSSFVENIPSIEDQMQGIFFDDSIDDPVQRKKSDLSALPEPPTRVDTCSDMENDRQKGTKEDVSYFSPSSRLPSPTSAMAPSPLPFSSPLSSNSNSTSMSSPSAPEKTPSVSDSPLPLSPESCSSQDKFINSRSRRRIDSKNLARTPDEDDENDEIRLLKKPDEKEQLGGMTTTDGTGSSSGYETPKKREVHSESLTGGDMLDVLRSGVVRSSTKSSISGGEGPDGNEKLRSGIVRSRTNTSISGGEGTDEKGKTTDPHQSAPEHVEGIRHIRPRRSHRKGHKKALRSGLHVSSHASRNPPLNGDDGDKSQTIENSPLKDLLTTHSTFGKDEAFQRAFNRGIVMVGWCRDPDMDSYTCNWSGNSSFSVHSPVIFRNIRRRFGLQEAEYLTSLCKPLLTDPKIKNPKLSSFYYSGDKRFVLKLVTRTEMGLLMSMLDKYYAYIMDPKNQDTLLTQYLGLYELTMGPKETDRHLLLSMPNIFWSPSQNQLLRFELKGFTAKRTLTDQEMDNEEPVLQDLDLWMGPYATRMAISGHRRESLLKQLRRDLRYLSLNGLTDYSLLLAVCKGPERPRRASFGSFESKTKVKPADQDIKEEKCRDDGLGIGMHSESETAKEPENKEQETLTMLSPSSSSEDVSTTQVALVNSESASTSTGPISRKKSTRQTTSESPHRQSGSRPSRSRLRRQARTNSATVPQFPPNSRASLSSRNFLFRKDFTGLTQRSLGIVSCSRDEIYFIGLVDTLQPFNNVRRVENFKKRAVSWLTSDVDEVGSEEPAEYSFRLYKFLESITTTIPVFGQVPRYRVPNRKQFIEQNNRDPLASDEEE